MPQELCERGSQVMTPIVWAGIGLPTDDKGMKNVASCRVAIDKILPAFNESGRYKFVPPIKGVAGMKQRGLSSRHIRDVALCRLVQGDGSHAHLSDIDSD